MNDDRYHLALSVLEVIDTKAFDILKSAPKNKRENILNAISAIHPEYHLGDGPVVAEAYPHLDTKIAAKIVLNMPVGQGLTKMERHRWLLDGAGDEPIKWLLKDTGLEARSMKVARWLLKMLSSPEQKEALYKTRRDGKLSDHTIDLIPSDCEGGVREAIIRRENRMKTAEFGAEELCTKPKWIRPLGGRVVVLNTAPALRREGDEMSHCVGGYASQVKSGACFIVSIRAWGHRATVEYSPSKSIVQIKGKSNRPPSMLCKRIAELAIQPSNTASEDRH